MPSAPPTLFISYSHDNEQHKDWVLKLASRLVANGVNTIFDQWDLTLGADLPRFMEQGLSDAKRVLAICTDSFVAKANSHLGGVGYEKMILTGQMMRNIASDRIIPAVRSGSADPPVPIFLSSRVYIDFRDDLAFESKYAELLRDIRGQQVKPRPPLGPNPFTTEVPPTPPLVSFGPEKYVAPAMAGKVTIDYSNNNGRFTLGAGDMAFETAWSTGGASKIYVYNDPPNIRTVALATDVKEISEIYNAASLDTSSRSRSPYLGQVVVWQNTAGYYLATKIVAIDIRRETGGSDSLTLEYRIAPGKSTSFAP